VLDEILPSYKWKTACIVGTIGDRWEGLPVIRL
jgi:hypothetical protein